jgi:hypothetical protein
MTLPCPLLARACIALILATASEGAGAWGMEAHQAIAMAAGTALTPHARQEVDRLLAVEPGSTLASIASWADTHRSATTSRWHYVNFPDDTCTYDAARDCADGACVVHAAAAQSAVLASQADPQARLTAMKYVVHLVGDIHQPLHAGHADDKGGNDYQVQAFGRGTNLHALWDTALVQRLEPDATQLAALLALRMATPAYEPDREPTRLLVEAAQESCALVQAPAFYPGHRIDLGYAQYAAPILLERMATAAARLAAILNRALDPQGYRP